MTLTEFIRENEVDYSFVRMNEDGVLKIEHEIGVSFGKQLKKYIIEYGYLGYEYIELFGINNHQGMDSDMIKTTAFLHKRFEKTRGLIAIEDQGDGDYYLVDADDMVYRFVAANDDLVAQNVDLFEYILNRFLSV